jgi:RNA polymerase sigma factor (sigma-70 family)
MLKVLISSKLSRLIGNKTTIKIAADWEEKFVYHTTPTGHRTKIQVKNLPPAEKEKYRPVKLTHDRQFNMTIPEVQQSIANYQKLGSPTEFRKLHANFQPLILSKVRKIVNSHPGHSWSKHDVEDLKQSADIILHRALVNADASNQGIISYIDKTLTRQMTGKARQFFEPHHVDIDAKDRRLLRMVKQYLFRHSGEQIDYETMAREINSDPSSKITHATPELIVNLLTTTGKMSLDEPIAKDEGPSTKHETIGNEGMSKDMQIDESAEEQRITNKIKKIIQESINAIDDPIQRKVIKMKYGLSDEYGSQELNPKEIAELLGKNRSYVRRQIDAAESALRRMDEIKRLRQSRSVLRIIKAFNKHVRFVYEPKTIVKVAANIINVDEYIVTKYSNQLVCSCGKNCFHKDIANKYFK